MPMMLDLWKIWGIKWLFITEQNISYDIDLKSIIKFKNIPFEQMFHLVFY